MLSPAALAKIDREVAKYPAGQRQSAAIAALAIAQDERGYLSPDAIEFVADYLGVAPIAVYEVATFYEMFDLEPVGEHKLCICTNLPCALAGATEAAAHLKAKLGLDWNQTSSDGRFTLKEGECFGACGDAPVVLVNNKKMLVGMTPRKLDAWLAEQETK
jgi:NADH-quinone oxidoreductase subunit E